MEGIGGVVIFLILFAVVLGVRFLANAAKHKSLDAIDNAIAKHKNEKNGATEENLSEIYGKDEEDNENNK